MKPTPDWMGKDDHHLLASHGTRRVSLSQWPGAVIISISGGGWVTETLPETQLAGVEATELGQEVEGE